MFNIGDLMNSPSDSVCFYSKNGNITINGSNIVLNGIIYAPNGKVSINGSTIKINGRVIANEIAFNGSDIRVISSDHDLDILPTSSIKL